jgi:predicted nucleic acid-binding protein
MALTHLADTSVLTRLSNPMVLDKIRPMAEAGALARASITDLELGFSGRNVDEWRAIIDAAEVCVSLGLEDLDVRRALQTQGRLAAAGHRGRKIPDLIIAAVAERRQLTLLHYDRDFDLIAAVTHQDTEWVVAAGSVD